MNRVYKPAPTSGSLRPCTEVPSTRCILKFPAISPFAAAVYSVSVMSKPIADSWRTTLRSNLEIPRVHAMSST